MIFERDYPGLVMPYYKNGDLVHFLRKNPQSDSDKLNLVSKPGHYRSRRKSPRIPRHFQVCEVAAGLEYLHNLRPYGVIHGDIKAVRWSSRPINCLILITYLV